jgi:hypothetical protein
VPRNLIAKNLHHIVLGYYEQLSGLHMSTPSSIKRSKKSVS